MSSSNRDGTGRLREIAWELRVLRSVMALNRGSLLASVIWRRQVIALVREATALTAERCAEVRKRWPG